MFESMDVFWAAFGGGAAAGVVTLLSVLLIEVLRWRLSAPKLRVWASFTFRVDPTDEWTQPLAIQMSNVRSRPVTISGYGIHYKSSLLSSRSVHLIDTDFPMKLLEGESHTIYVDPSRLRHAPAPHTSSSSGSMRIRSVFVFTSDGREFRSKLKGLSMSALAESMSEFRARRERQAP